MSGANTSTNDCLSISSGYQPDCTMPLCPVIQLELQHTCNPELHGQRIKQRGGFFLSCWTISSEPLIKLWIPSTHEKLPGMLLLYLITLLINFICCQVLHNSQLFFLFFLKKIVFWKSVSEKNVTAFYLDLTKAKVPKVKVKQLHLPVKKRKRNEPLHWSTERDYFIEIIFLLAETFGIKKASRTVNCIDFL